MTTPPPPAPSPGEIAARIARTAERQQGVISRKQLVAIGLGPGAVDYRLMAGQLVPAGTGVYRLPGRPAPLAWAMAAALSGGEGTAVDRRSAAAVHSIGDRGRLIEVTAPRRLRRRGIDSRAAVLPRHHATRHLGVPVTTIPRTVIDLAQDPGFPLRRLMEVVNRARLQRPRLLEEIGRVLPETGCPDAAARLMPVLADRSGPVRSDLEASFRALVAEGGFPPAFFNVRVAGLEVDVHWPAARLVVELDGRAFHDDPRSFERDRERDGHLLAAGHSVYRLTWRRLQDQPEFELRRLAEIVRGRTPPPAADGTAG